MGTAGARLALVGRRRDKLDALASRLAASGVDAAVFTADVTDEASVAALAAAVNAWSPNPQILINSAGTNIRKNLVEFSLAEFRSVIDSSLISTFLACHAFVPGMMGTGYGRIINLASIMAHISLPGRTAYSSAKASLLGLTKALALELAAEGITRGVHLVGDVMFDAGRMFAPLAEHRGAPAAHGLEPGGYLLVTIHRAAATDTPEALDAMVRVLSSLGRPAIFPVHPRTRAKLQAGGRWDALQAVPGLILAPPVGYLDFTSLLMGAQAVVTDSGGVQKEAYFHGVPCVTLRDTTEWVETVEGGFNTLTGMDPAKVQAALAELSMPAERPPYYGDGHAADAIARAVVAELG